MRHSVETSRRDFLSKPFQVFKDATSELSTPSEKVGNDTNKESLINIADIVLTREQTLKFLGGIVAAVAAGGILGSHEASAHAKVPNSSHQLNQQKLPPPPGDTPNPTPEGSPSPSSTPTVESTQTPTNPGDSQQRENETP